MKRREDFLRDEDGFFGPGWDLAIALIAVLILTLALEAAARQQAFRRERQGEFEIQRIRERQMHLVDQLAAHYSVQRRELGTDTYGIFIGSRATEPDITIHNDATLQRLSFGDHILFASDEVVLLPGGTLVLTALADVLKGELNHLMEIQIQGHADTLKPKAFKSNLELAARRAMTVYQALESSGIDPARSIMSATSFGDYVPVTRSRSDAGYSRARLLADNDQPTKQRLNRRIEVVLIYRQ